MALLLRPAVPAMTGAPAGAVRKRGYEGEMKRWGPVLNDLGNIRDVQCQWVVIGDDTVTHGGTAD